MLVVTVSRVILLALPRLVIWPIIAAWFDPKPISRNRKKRTAEGCNIDRHFQAYVTRIRPRVLPVGTSARKRWQGGLVVGRQENRDIDDWKEFVCGRQSATSR